MTIDSSGLPFPKRTRRERSRQKAQQKAVEHEIIRQTRELVFALDTVCVVCGGLPLPTDEMHEVVARSKTRGLSPLVRFSRRVCVRVHRACHRGVTEHRVELAFLNPLEGADGGVLIQRRGSLNVVLYRRGTAPRHMVTTLRGVVRRGRWQEG